MKVDGLIWLAVAGLMILAVSLTGCAGNPDDAKRELIVAGGPDAIYVLDAKSGDLYELSLNESMPGWFRELEYEHPPGAAYLPVAKLDVDGAVKLYISDAGGLFELTVTKGEDKFIQEKRKLDIAGNETILAIDGDDLLLATPEGSRIIEGPGEYTFKKPDGDFSKPVAAKSPYGEWIVVWPEKIEELKDDRDWSDFAMKGPGKIGIYTVQVISTPSDAETYRLENETYAETRAGGLIGVLVDAGGRLLILDDKGYISIFDGESLVFNFFAGLSPSRYAVNSISGGPDGNVLVTDAISWTVTMTVPDTGEVVAGWRILPKKKQPTSISKGFGCAVDIALLIVVIYLIIGISRRMRRHHVYRRRDGDET